MFKKELFSKSKSYIGDNANGNNVFQNNTFNNPTIVAGSSNDMIKMLAEADKYDLIQDMISSQLSDVRTIHPLYPDFSAKVDSELNKLVSTPETEEALKKYPKIIKGTWDIDYSKYPYMNKAETPWEYAYRTQTIVELKVESYQEYLGDTKDPYPAMTYADGVVTVIEPPEFPKAFDAKIHSGDVEIPIQLRRVPCMEYNKVILRNVSSHNILDFEIILDKSNSDIKFNINRVLSDNLNQQLLVEKLLCNIYNLRNIILTIDGKELINSTIASSDLEKDILKNAPFFKKYIESLLTIERLTKCHFNPNIKSITNDEYQIAIIMSESLEGRWRLSKKEFDKIRCNYDCIDNNIIEHSKSINQLYSILNSLSVHLQGVYFSIEKYTSVYKNIKINNSNSVEKNIKRKKKNILITLKPDDNRKAFDNYEQFEGISLKNDDSKVF